MEYLMERDEADALLQSNPTSYENGFPVNSIKISGDSSPEQHQNISNSSSVTDTIDTSADAIEYGTVNSLSLVSSNHLRSTTKDDSFFNVESDGTRKPEIATDCDESSILTVNSLNLDSSNHLRSTTKDDSLFNVESDGTRKPEIADCDESSILKRKLSEIHSDANSVSGPTSPRNKKPRTENLNDNSELDVAPDKQDNSALYSNCVQCDGFETLFNPKTFKSKDEMTYLWKQKLQFSDLGKIFGNVEMTTDHDPMKKFEYAQCFGIQPTVKFQCIICSDSNFTTFSELTQHKKFCQKGRKGEKMPCEMITDSNRRMIDEDILNETTKTIQMDTQIRITRKVFLCSACGTYYENWSLYDHIKQVHERFFCLHCLGIFPSAERLSSHLEVKHNIKPVIYEKKQQFLDSILGQCFITCVKCSNNFCETDDFTNHSCENYVQPCSLCGVKFRHNANCKAAANNKLAKHKRSSNRHRKVPSRVNQSFDMSGSEKPLSKHVAGQINGPEREEVDTSEQNLEQSNHSIVASTPAKELTFNHQVMLNNVTKFSQASLFPELSLEKIPSNDDHQRNDSSSSQINSILKQEFGGPPLDSQYLDFVNGGQDNKLLPSTKIPLNAVSIHGNGKIEDDDETDSSARSPSPIPTVEEKPQPLLVPKLKLNLKNFQTPIESEESSTESDDDDMCQNADDDEEHEEHDEPNEPDEIQFNEDVVRPAESQDEEIMVEKHDDTLNDSQTDEVNVEDEDDNGEEDMERKFVPNVPTEDVDAAGDDVVAVDLLLHQPLDKIPVRDFLRICLRNTYPTCLYCNHARKISVDGNSLALHMITAHRFTATVDSITAEELQPTTIVQLIKSSLDELNGIYFNLDSYDSADREFTIPYEKQYECFQCRFQSRVHKDLYLHNRKMHLKSMIMCLMCKSNFYSYSELVCHMCPGSNKKLVPFELTFRCVLCNLDNIPSAFRLMVHLRKKHFACDVCLEECYDQSKLSSHVWKHKLHHLCYRCGIAYRNKPDITKHLFWKHGTESVLCKRCLHKKWPHVYHFCIPPSTFDCELCGMSFSKAVALKVHKRIHSEDAPYPCTEDGCEKKFISRKLLLKHVGRHYMSTEEIKKEEEEEENIVPIVEQMEQKPTVPEEEEEEVIMEQSTVTEVESEEKKTRKPKKAKSVREACKNLMDIIDLPAPNLSESDSSEESDSDRPTNPVATPAFISNPVDDLAIEDDPVTRTVEIEDELAPPPPVKDIWEKFKSYQASQIQKQSFDDEADTEVFQPPPILHVVQSDHDYVCMYKPFIEKPKEIKIDSPVDAIESIEQTLINITEGDKPVIIEQPQAAIQELKPMESVKSPGKSPKKGFSPKKCLVSAKSDSSSDSSDSDSSSCSCGSNCSCTTSSSGSSSSSSSDSDSSSSEGRRTLELKKVLKQERERVKCENANLSDNIDVVNTDKTDEHIVSNDPDSVIFESDLETDESETDEDFYDEHPQRLANQLLAEKRKQLMQTCLSPMNSFDIIENSRPSTPSLPEEMIKEKKVRVKKRKKERKSSKNVASLKLNIPLKLIEPKLESNASVIVPETSTPTYNSSQIEANKVKISIVTPKSNKSIKISGAPNSSNISRLSTGSSCSDIEIPLKRSQRRRIPNKFYGYNSDEDTSDLLSNPFKPTPPPNLTWNKEDLPQTPTVVRTPPIKTVIKLPPATNFKLTQPDHHPPAQLFESKSFISPKPLPLPHKPIQSVQPPIPPIIIRPNRIQQQQQQPQRLEALRVPAVPVRHITATQDSEQSASESDSESSDDQTLHISQPQIPQPPPVLSQTIPINFQSSEIRYPIMPPAGCRPAREGESVYCYCRCPYDEVSEMIACDGSDCEIEWFHFECVNIMVPPKGTWYCPQCRPKYASEIQNSYESIT